LENKISAILVAGVLLLAAAAFLLRHTVFLDAEAYRLSLVFSGRLASDEKLESSLPTRFHKGPGACLRYPAKPTDPEVSAAATALLDAGFAPSEVSDVFGVFLEWAEATESPAHALSENDEHWQVTLERLDWKDRLVFGMNKAKFQALEKSANPEHQARGKAAFAQLPEAKKQMLRTIWEKHPNALTLSGLVRVLTEMKRRITVERMDRLVESISAEAKKNGKMPWRLREFAEAGLFIVDGWGTRFDYEVTEKGATLVSLGQDQSEGGTDEAADLRREIALPSP
jgi:hypothetical protein